MRVKWLRAALSNLNAASAYIARDNPKAVDETVQRIVDAICALADNPQLDTSRAGRVPGTRELIIDRIDLVAYRIRRGELEILRVLHAKQRSPDRFP